MAPIVNRLERSYGDQIRFVYLDIDDPAVAPTAKELNLIRQPQFYLLDAEGTILDQWAGLVSEDKFVDVFEAFLAGTLQADQGWSPP